jgi:hypothetical protein
MADSRGHAVIVNMVSYSSFVFQFNPEKVETEKKINYAMAPNIGGAYKHRYFSGFDTKELSFKIMCFDKESPLGVTEEIAFFEQLREPDPGVTGGWGLIYGNINYPPPQILFQFGVSIVPLVWDVLDIKVSADHFHSDLVRGIMGVPKKCDVDIALALDEDHVLNKANQVAKKAMAYAATAKSVYREYQHWSKGSRKESTGLFGNGFRGTR